MRKILFFSFLAVEPLLVFAYLNDLGLRARACDWVKPQGLCLGTPTTAVPGHGVSRDPAVGHLPQKGPLVWDSPNCTWAGVTPARGQPVTSRNSSSHFLLICSPKLHLTRGIPCSPASFLPLATGETLWHSVPDHESSACWVWPILTTAITPLNEGEHFSWSM